MNDSHAAPKVAAPGVAQGHGPSALHHAPLMSLVHGAKASLGQAAADDISLEYWAELFGAVLERLNHVVDAGSGDAANSDRTRVVVLECAAALGQMRSTLVREADRLRALQRLPGDALGNVADAVPGPERRSRPRALPVGGPLQPDADFPQRRLEHAVADAASKGQTLTLLQMDLDGLNRVASDHGHEAADMVRRIVAQRLGRSIRAADFVNSTGSNGFSMAFAGLPDRATVSRLAVKLLDAVSPVLKIGALSLTVRPSIGIALFPENGQHASSLLQAAASALQRALELRCGYAYFDELQPVTGTAESGRASGAPDPWADTVGAARSWDRTSAFEAVVPDATEPPGSADAMLAAYWGSGGIARGDDLARLLKRLDRGEPQSLSALIAARQVFGFDWHRAFWVPMFQFDLDSLTLKPGSGAVISELKPVFNGWELASWFAHPNSLLNGSRPVDVVDSDPAAVLGAARIDRFVAAG